MPHTNTPVWDSQTSTIKNPVLLIEGRFKRIVDADEVTTRIDGGRAIFVESVGSQAVRTDPVKGKDESGKDKIFYTRRTMKVVRRKSQPPGLRGESSKMTPGRPTNGSVGSSNYGRLLDGLVSGFGRARKLFASRKTLRHNGRDFPVGVPHELTMQTAERAILYMPSAGQAARGTSMPSKARIRMTEDGWEIFDRGVYKLITEGEARAAIGSGAAVLIQNEAERELPKEL